MALFTRDDMQVLENSTLVDIDSLAIRSQHRPPLGNHAPCFISHAYGMTYRAAVADPDPAAGN